MKLRHFDHDGRARFVTFCTHRRIPLLTNNHFRQIVIDELDHMRNDTGTSLLGYVIMPKHLHLVVVPPLEVKLGKAIGDMKRRSAEVILEQITDQALLKLLTIRRDGKLRSAFWQRRCFDHNCRSDDSVLTKIEYIHNNPMTRGLVEHPGDFPWSNYRWYHGLAGVVLNLDVSAFSKLAHHSGGVQ